MLELIVLILITVIGIPLMMAVVGGIYMNGGAPRQINSISG